MAVAAAIATAGGFSGARSLSARLLSLLSPGAAQLLIYPVDERCLFQNRAGTVPVTADGQVVGRILDVGPLGRHLTAVSDPARGVFRRSGRYRWIEFNGVNTAYSTAALPAPGVDKAQVFAAARKLSDATQSLVELSPHANLNAGSFQVISGTANSAEYSSLARGDAAASTAQLSRWIGSGLAPDTAVLTVTHDIAGDLSTMRRNGIAGTNGTGDKGAGNFNTSGTYPLFVGARNGSGLFLNGRVYGALITRFSVANLSTATITAVEALLTAEITGAP